MVLVETLNEFTVTNKKPLLGICVGLQMFADLGYEETETKGLGWISGKVSKIDNQNNKFKLPHIGWNEINIVKESKIFKNIENKSHMYFVHSYEFIPDDKSVISSTTNYSSKKCFVPLTVGGGVRGVEDINKLLNCGADKVSINTAAVQSPEMIIESSKKFGSQCIVVAIDAKKNGDKWEVFTHGGRNNTNIDAIEFAKKMEDNGAGELLVTSMDRDGTQIGYDNDLMFKISSTVNIPIIASGGVGNLDHLVDGIRLGNASAVLAASIFHYGTHSINEAKQYLNSKGIPVRI